MRSPARASFAATGDPGLAAFVAVLARRRRPRGRREWPRDRHDQDPRQRELGRRPRHRRRRLPTRDAARGRADLDPRDRVRDRRLVGAARHRAGRRRLPGARQRRGRRPAHRLSKKAAFLEKVDRKIGWMRLGILPGGTMLMFDLNGLQRLQQPATDTRSATRSSRCSPIAPAPRSSRATRTSGAASWVTSSRSSSSGLTDRVKAEPAGERAARGALSGRS